MSRIALTTLGDIADLQAGVGFPLELQGRDSGDYPLAKVGDISRVARSGQTTMFAAEHYVDEEDLPRLKAKPIPPGSILFSKIGEAIRQNHRVIAGCPLLIDNNAMAAIPNARVESRFLYHFLRTVDFYALASATTVPALRKSVLERLSVPLPPLPEQRRIAEILDKADALRSKRRAALAQLDTLTQSIFLDMFGDPATNPKEWQRRALKEMLTGPLRNGLSPSKRGRVSAEVLTLSAITGSVFDETARKTSTFQSRPPSQQAVSSSDFLICRGNGNVRLVGRGRYPSRSLPEVTFPDTMIAARVSDQMIDPAFLEHVWNSNEVRRQIQSLARTTNGTFKVNQTMLEGITLVVPPLRLQCKFSRLVKAIREVKKSEAKSLVQLDDLFAALQQRAFSGELIR